jgi:regulator of sigma D
MKDSTLTPDQFWPQMHERIENWLEARKKLLVSYCELSETRDFSNECPQQGMQLQTFCEQLIDYTSEGHFEIFEQLLNEGYLFSDAKGLAIGEKLLTTIHSHTELVVDFNDKYLATEDLTTLAADLSVLGEVLAQRLEVEDKMVDILHNAHYQEAL